VPIHRPIRATLAAWQPSSISSPPGLSRSARRIGVKWPRLADELGATVVECDVDGGDVRVTQFNPRRFPLPPWTDDRTASMLEPTQRRTWWLDSAPFCDAYVTYPPSDRDRKTGRASIGAGGGSPTLARPRRFRSCANSERIDC
jgi:hypothetical protein